MKVIRLTELQMNVLFHVLNNAYLGIEEAKRAAEEMDGISPADFIRAHNSVLLAAINPWEEEGDPRIL